MLLRVSHRTQFDYTDEISDTSMELRLRPREGEGQRCLAYELRLEPPGPVRSFPDAFGNTVETYNQRGPHQRLVVEARSRVETSRERTDPRELTRGERFQMLRPEGPVVDLPEIRAMAAELAPGGAPDATPELLARLAAHVHGRFVYEPNVTTVDSTVADLLRLGRGVCQDFAHLWIGLCRTLGIPARYVSGYIWPGGDARGGQASHAWGEGWVPGVGWIGYDPTNWRAATGGRVGEHHVVLAIGRSYRDVPPTRGVYRGTARERLAVDVQVEMEGLRRARGVILS